MGSLLTRAKKVEIKEHRGVDGESRDKRRRNSLAYNISQFVKAKEAGAKDFSYLVNEVAIAIQQEMPPDSNPGAAKKIPRYTRMAMDVLSGNYRELKAQVIVNWKLINRRYKDAMFFGGTVLHFVCQEGYISMLEFLLNDSNHPEFDSDVVLEVSPKNGRNRTPLLLCFTPPTATYIGQNNGVGSDGMPKAIRPEDVDLAGDYVMPGGESEREQSIRALMLCGADILEPDFHGFTCLHYACMYGWTTTVKMLLGAGADINAITVTNRSPLMYAVELNRVAVVEVLLKTGRVKIDDYDSEGATPLLLAMEKENKEEEEAGGRGGGIGIVLMEMLLRAGADPNLAPVVGRGGGGGSSSQSDREPFHIACEANNLKQVFLLMDFKVQRKGSDLALLTGEVAEAVRQRIEAEEKAAKAEYDRLEKERETLALTGGVGTVTTIHGYKSKSPWGQWVEYRDKRDGSAFYYNLVTRDSQREKPSDFTPDPSKPVKDATFGMHFYH